MRQSINLQGIQINLNLTFVEWHSTQHHLSVIANLDSNMENTMVKDKLVFTAGYLYWAICERTEQIGSFR